MKELIQNIGAYAGELLIASIAVIIRSVEIKFMIRKKRKEWEAGEIYTKVLDDPDKK